MTCSCSKETIISGNKCSETSNGKRECSDGVHYVKRQLEQPPKKAVLACEGGCIKGEIARVAANILAYKLQRENTVRICLGDAATGDSGFLDLLTRAPEIIAVEGCPLHCGTEIIRKRIPLLETSIVDASSLYEFDRCKYFEIFDMPRSEVEVHAHKVAEYIEGQMLKGNLSYTQNSQGNCCESGE